MNIDYDSISSGVITKINKVIKDKEEQEDTSGVKNYQGGNTRVVNGGNSFKVGDIEVKNVFTDDNARGTDATGINIDPFAQNVYNNKGIRGDYNDSSDKNPGYNKDILDLDNKNIKINTIGYRDEE